MDLPRLDAIGWQGIEKEHVVHATCGIDWAEDHVRHEALEVERG
ncbi:hypothetical protein ACIREM_38140 [Streptomyces shenzhenensis]